METTKFVAKKISIILILIIFSIICAAGGFDSKPGLILSLLPFFGFIYLTYSTLKFKKGEIFTKSKYIASIILAILELYILVCVYRYGFLDGYCLSNSNKIAAKSDIVTLLCSI